MLSLVAFVFSADDSSRVLLSVPNTSGTDYINASFVDVSETCTVSLFRLVQSRQLCMKGHCNYNAIGSSCGVCELSITFISMYYSICCRAIRRRTHSLPVKVC